MMTENSSQEIAQTSATTEASAAASITQAPEAAASSSQATGQEQGQNAEVQKPVFNPNFKFKAFDKEYEIEELYRPLIKDPDTEEKVKKLFSKAYAMEKMQEERNKARKDYEDFRNKVDPDVKSLNYFNTLLKNKDWDNFFSGLKVPEDEIFNWVSKRLELLKAPAEQRAEFEKQNQIRMQNYHMQQQMEQQTKMYQEQAVQTRAMQLDSLMSRTDVSSKAEAIDNKMGQIGAFRNLVIEEAASHFYRTGEDLTAENAVQLVLNKFGKFVDVIPPSNGVANQGAQSPASGQNQGAGQMPPVIPHVAGRGASPIKKTPKSLDDLKNMAKAL